MYTPATSRHFTTYVDPQSGMISYILSTRVAPVQQAFYFVNSSVDGDARRYFWFYCAFPPSESRCTGVVDFLTDEIRLFPETTGSGWLVDPLTGNLWWGNKDGIFMRTPHPDDQPVQIASMPAEIARWLGGSMGGTHLTFSPDRRELFIDVQSAGGTFIGTIEIATGAFTQWYRTEPGIPYNHGQFCPTNGDLAMVAHEGSYNLELGKRQSPAFDPDGVYPRLQLIHRDGTRERRTPLNNYATHEFWAPNGQCIYYCSMHHIARDRLGASEPESVCHIPIEGGNGTWHAHCSRDEKYFVADGSWPSHDRTWWRGCPSFVRFYNDETKKLVFLCSLCPELPQWSP
ncbi:MAG: hypothetical protein IKM07_06805, partial [Clostridia bacterium]|nr:hypothetical protein [Clostridia bacterium]